MLRRAALFSSSLTSAGVIDGVIQDDWEKINEICKAGRTKDFYPLGSYKPLELLNGAGTVNMIFAGMNKEVRADGQCLPTTTWGSEGPTLSTQLSLECLPITIRSALVEVIKLSPYASGYPRSGSVTETVTIYPTTIISKEKIWDPLPEEISTTSPLYGEAMSARPISASFKRGINSGTVKILHIKEYLTGMTHSFSGSSGKKNLFFCL